MMLNGDTQRHYYISRYAQVIEIHLDQSDIWLVKNAGRLISAWFLGIVFSPLVGPQNANFPLRRLFLDRTQTVGVVG